MRLLASTTANDGHAGPLFSFVRACADAGHEVAVAAPHSYATAVRRAGFAHVPFDDAPSELVGPVMARLPDLDFDEADAVVIREVFGRIDAQAALPGLRAAVTAWQPDLVLREPAELASLAAAEHHGTPHAQVVIGMQELTRRIAGLVEEPLAELALLAGVPAGRLVHALSGERALSLVPEALDRAGDPDYRTDLPVDRFRHELPPAEAAAGWTEWGDPGLPLLYVTFGSVTGSLAPFAGVFREALDALGEQPVRVLMTVGRRFDPAALGPVPANSRVERWLPQAAVLARATAVLGHGGFGTTSGAFATGLPQLIAPLFSSDQVCNGVHVAAFGAGLTVPPGPGSVTRVAGELHRLLTDSAFGERARAGAVQMAELPPLSTAVPLLEQLAGVPADSGSAAGPTGGPPTGLGVPAPGAAET